MKLVWGGFLIAAGLIWLFHLVGIVFWQFQLSPVSIGIACLITTFSLIKEGVEALQERN